MVVPGFDAGYVWRNVKLFMGLNSPTGRHNT